MANGDWTVGLNCNGGDDSLNSILSGSFECPPTTNVIVNNNSGTANFTVQICAGAVIYTTSLSSGQVNSYYDLFLQGSTCNGTENWSLNDPQDFPGSLNLSQNGESYGTPDTPGTFNFSVNLSDGGGNSTNQSLSLTINPAVAALQVTTLSLPNGTNGVFYSTALQATGGQTPYSWSLAQGSAGLPANLALGTNGVISGTPDTAATNYEFIALVTDASSSTAYQVLSLNITGGAPRPPLALVRQTGNGVLEFTFTSVAGVNYSVQSSSNLTNWTTVLTFTGEGGLETLSAPTTGGGKAMFYRVKMGP